MFIFCFLNVVVVQVLVVVQRVVNNFNPEHAGMFMKCVSCMIWLLMLDLTTANILCSVIQGGIIFKCCRLTGEAFQQMCFFVQFSSYCQQLCWSILKWAIYSSIQWAWKLSDPKLSLSLWTWSHLFHMLFKMEKSFWFSWIKFFFLLTIDYLSEVLATASNASNFNNAFTPIQH